MQQLIQLIKDPFFQNSALYEIFIQDEGYQAQINQETNFQGLFQKCSIDIDVLQAIRTHYKEQDWDQLSLYIEICNKFLIKIPLFYEFCQESDVWTLRHIINNFDQQNVRVENFLEIISFQKLVELQEIVDSVSEYNQYFAHLQNFKIIFIDSQTFINYYYPRFMQNQYSIIVAKNASIDQSVFYNQKSCKMLVLNNCNHLLSSPNFIYSNQNQEFLKNLSYLSIQYEQKNVKNSDNLPYFDFHLFPNLISLYIDCCCVYFLPETDQQLKLQYLQVGKILKFKQRNQKQFPYFDVIKLQKSFAQNSKQELVFILSAFIQKFTNLQQIAIGKYCFKNQDLSMLFHDVLNKIGAFQIVDNSYWNNNIYFQNYVNYQSSQ